MGGRAQALAWGGAQMGTDMRSLCGAIEFVRVCKWLRAVRVIYPDVACRQTQRTDESCINLYDERHRPGEGIGGSPDRLCRAVCIVCRVSSVCILSILHCGEVRALAHAICDAPLRIHGYWLWARSG
jgi:hypothetical protein